MSVLPHQSIPAGMCETTRTAALLSDKLKKSGPFLQLVMTAIARNPAKTRSGTRPRLSKPCMFAMLDSVSIWAE